VHLLLFSAPSTLSITLPLPRLYLRYAKRLYAAAEHELGVKLNASEAARDRAETESLLLAESSLRLTAQVSADRRSCLNFCEGALSLERLHVSVGTE